MTLQDINRELLIGDRPKMVVLSKTSTSKVIAIGLNNGVKIKDHKPPGSTKIVVVKGELLYSSERYEKIISAMDEYQIPLDELHAVVANKPTIFLLLVSL